MLCDAPSPSSTASIYWGSARLGSNWAVTNTLLAPPSVLSSLRGGDGCALSKAMSSAWRSLPENSFQARCFLLCVGLCVFWIVYGSLK